MPRFTISHHTAGPQPDHYDLFLQVETTLKSWRLQRTLFDAAQVATRTEDHRIQYLDYEGPVSKDRGQVKLWDTGTYEIDLWSDDLIIVAIRGRQLKIRLRLDRAKGKEGEAASAWNVIDPSVSVRKLATSLLRESSLDAAPSDGLQDVHAALLTDERALLALVDAYGRGGPVAWNSIPMNPAIRERLASERARWRHPWFDAALAHAGRLEEIAKLLRAAKP